MCSHVSEEKFGQPGVSCGTQVLQEFHMDVVVTWGCRCMVSSSAEQLKSPLQLMDEEDSCLASAAEEFCPARTFPLN